MEVSCSLTSNYTTKSKQCDVGIKADIQINGTELRTQNEIHTNMNNYFMAKQPRTYNAERTVFLINGVGNTRYPKIKK